MHYEHLFTLTLMRHVKNVYNLLVQLTYATRHQECDANAKRAQGWFSCQFACKVRIQSHREGSNSAQDLSVSNYFAEEIKDAEPNGGATYLGSVLMPRRAVAQANGNAHHWNEQNKEPW